MSRSRHLVFWGLLAGLVLLAKLGVWVWAQGIAIPAETPEVPPPELSFAAVAAKLQPAVALIEVFEDGKYLQRVSVGVGFAVDTEGTIVTNYHVIAPGEYIRVHMVQQGKVYSAVRAETDARLDIALLVIDAETEPVVWGKRLQLESGDQVGFLATDGLTYRAEPGKVITASGYKDGQWFIHTDVAATLGHSGSPLFTMDGKVVGMISFIIPGTSGTAVSIAVAADDIEEVMKR
jgi:serine protease Do